MATQVSEVDRSYWGRFLFPAPIAPQGRGHTRGSAGAQSEQPDPITPVLRSDETDSNVRDRGVQQPLETTAERTSGGGQDDEHGHDPIQSGRSKGESQCSGCTMVYIDRYYQSRREPGSVGLLGVLWL